jgi:hypothetical protein
MRDGIPSFLIVSVAGLLFIPVPSAVTSLEFAHPDASRTF